MQQIGNKRECVTFNNLSIAYRQFNCMNFGLSYVLSGTKFSLAILLLLAILRAETTVPWDNFCRCEVALSSLYALTGLFCLPRRVVNTWTHRLIKNM